jgi:alpha-tubulin suppressor-like RCC1 family protein
VSAGYDHTCGLRTDGTIACWGNNAQGQATPPAGSFTAVSVGDNHTCALRTAGTIACWGYNGYGQAAPPAGSFTAVSARGSYTCALRPDGTITCWGYNGYGQATPPGGSFTAVSAGGYHTCGLRTDGTIACWGYNAQGQATPPTTRVAPEATFTWPVGGVTAGQSFTLSLSGASVPGHPEARTFTYAFDCGSGVFGAASPSASTTCATASTTPGGTTLTVRGAVIDQDDDWGQYIEEVTITQPPAP